MLGMPVVALGATEAPFAVPPEAGVVTTRRDRFLEAVTELAKDLDRAEAAGRAARAHAVEHFGLERFLRDWDVLLAGAR